MKGDRTAVASIDTIASFNKNIFHSICDDLGKRDPHLQSIIAQYGYPPMWRRNNSFASLIHIILEQQVSLASAKAAFIKLKEKIGKITPEKLLTLSDEEMKACYFSRQKTVYARHLAEMILSGKVVLTRLRRFSNDEIRTQLKQVKGIGDWTVDIYLLFVLQRTDIFPHGDLAMMNALREVKKLKSNAGKEKIIELSGSWKPYRSIATMLFWHYYIQKRNIRL
jgi:DNA-3-methyladenine glycosylase II